MQVTMGFLHHLETQPERQIPDQLQAPRQQALDDGPPLCNRRGPAMPRHRRYAHAIDAGYDEIRLPIPCPAAARAAGKWLRRTACGRKPTTGILN